MSSQHNTAEPDATEPPPPVDAAGRRQWNGLVSRGFSGVRALWVEGRLSLGRDVAGPFLRALGGAVVVEIRDTADLEVAWRRLVGCVGPVAVLVADEVRLDTHGSEAARYLRSLRGSAVVLRTRALPALD